MLSQETTITYEKKLKIVEPPILFEYNLDDKGLIKSNEIFDFEKGEMINQRQFCSNSIIVSERNLEDQTSIDEEKKK